MGWAGQTARDSPTSHAPVPIADEISVAISVVFIGPSSHRGHSTAVTPGQAALNRTIWSVRWWLKAAPAPCRWEPSSSHSRVKNSSNRGSFVQRIRVYRCILQPLA